MATVTSRMGTRTPHQAKLPAIGHVPCPTPLLQSAIHVNKKFIFPVSSTNYRFTPLNLYYSRGTIWASRHPTPPKWRIGFVPPHLPHHFKIRRSLENGFVSSKRAAPSACARLPQQACRLPIGFVPSNPDAHPLRSRIGFGMGSFAEMQPIPSQKLTAENGFVW